MKIIRNSEVRLEMETVILAVGKPSSDAINTLNYYILTKNKNKYKVTVNWEDFSLQSHHLEDS